MQSVVRALAVCGLIVGLVATASPVGADGYFATDAQYAHPRQYTNEVIWVALCDDPFCDFPQVGVPVHTVWNYRTDTPTLDWQTGSDGMAAMTRNIGPATCGFTVRVDIYVGDEQTQIDSAYFTPAC
ncbi:MAG: hypothetical protein M3Y58_12345 [Chloroflexota bacterium]|nr:hypothetical protein [Chloroflexota bacterium]